MFNDDKVIIILVMLGVAMFVVGALIASLLRPLSDAVDVAIKSEVDLLNDGNNVVEERHDALVGAGKYIGWLERLVVFLVVVLGRPEAIVLVLTAKSFARFPSFKNEAFGEYFLIGTLLSLVLAVAAAVATRSILGLSPL